MAVNKQVEHVGSIAIVVPAIAREGITKQVANQVAALHGKKVEVSLIVLSEFKEEVMRELNISIASASMLQLNQKDAYLSPKALLSANATFLPILKFLKKNKVKAVIAHAPYAHFILRGVKQLALVHRYEFKLYQYFHSLQYAQFPVNTFRRTCINRLNILLGKLCDDGHIFASKAIKADVEANFMKHPNNHVIYNSLPEHTKWGERETAEWKLLQKRLGERADQFSILIPNRIEYNKGQLFFLEVLEKLIHTEQIKPSEEVILFIVGEGPQKEEVKRAVKTKKLDKAVVVTGELSNAVVQKLMQHINLVVVPSFFEGFSFAVLEAIKAECLVLASNMGGINEIIDHAETGFLFQPGNRKDCLDKLMYIYRNRDKELLDKAKLENVFQQRFALAKNVNQLLSILGM